MDLNKRQKQLLELLSINCRFSNRDVARSLHCSEDAVEYQIKKLIEEEKMGSFNIQFDYYLMGYQQYHLLIRVRDLNISYAGLAKISSIISINSSYGKYDLQLIALIKEKHELEAALGEIRKIIDIQEIVIAEFSSYIKQFTNILPPFAVHAKIPRNKKNHLYELSERQYSRSTDRSLITLDETDKKIIKQLLKDPRLKFSDIAQNTNLNHETVRYRVNGYVKRRFIMNFGILHDFQKYGLYPAQLLVTLKQVSQKLKDFLHTNVNVFYAGQLIGAYSGVIYIVSHDPLELGEKLKEIRYVLKDDLISTDLLHFEKIYKYVQFPFQELESKT